MKVFIDVDELYPFYQIIRMTHGKMNEIGAVGNELPLDKVKWIERVMSEFEEVQNYLRQFDKVDYIL
jgi:hypothetical protein